ncbi:MAG: Gfo/Idh/MocA family oxidoreductase, partial [Clostridia bacterium]|nr:Gfo/Idh/MocA family oxidoreductase [Clostridia bacterium]
MAIKDAALDAFKHDQEGTKAVDASKKVKVGIIGTGWIADCHIDQYKEMPDVELVAVADLIPGKAEAFLAKHGMEGVRVYPNDKAMIDAEDLDAVSVCTYNCQHAEPTIYAL